MHFISKIRSLKGNYTWWATVAISLGTLVTVADTGEVGVALPNIANDLDTNLGHVQWLVTGYLLAISVLLMPMGRLSDMIGRKKVYLSGIAIFVLGSGLAYVSPDFSTLLGFRVLQGIGLGLVHGNSMAIMTSIFESNERGKALGIQMTMVGIGLIIGPLFGGVLVGSIGWRAVFLANVFLGLLVFIFGMLVLNDRLDSRFKKNDSQGDFDFPGTFLSGAFLVLFLFATADPFNWPIILQVSVFLLSVATLSLFVFWETRTSSPMFDINLFKNRLFTLGVVCRSLTFVCSATTLFLMPFYLQDVLFFEPKQVGLCMTTLALGLVIFGALSGRLSDVVDWRIFAVLGSLMSSVGLFMLVFIGQDTSLWLILPALLLQSFGMGFFTPANSNAILGVVPKSRVGISTGFIQLLRTASTVTGVATATMIITWFMNTSGFEANVKDIVFGADPGMAIAFVSGLRAVYLIAAILQLVVLAISLVSGDGKGNKVYS